MNYIITRVLLIAALLISFAGYAQPWTKSAIVSTITQPAEHKQNFHDIQKIFNDYWKDRKPGVNDEDNKDDYGYLQFRRWEALMKPRTFPTGEMFNPEILYKEYKKQQDKNNMLRNSQPQTHVANWTLIGPSVVPSSGGGIGRINAVRFDPTDANTIFACTANGGMWKSTNAGSTWTTTTDQLPSIGCADVAVNPIHHDSIYMATGDRDGYELGTDFWGGVYSAGVMVSGDGGLTWNTTGLSYVQTQTNIIHRLLMSPLNTNILLAATRTGIWRTTDAGVTWSRPSLITLVDTFPFTSNTYDMEFNTANSNTIYAVSASTLYTSTDAGATWTQTFTGLGGSGSIISVTDANPQVIYTINGDFVVRKSTNGGTSFTTLTDPSSVINNQGFYDCAIAVSHTSESTIVIAGSTQVNNGTGIAKSTNSGSSWSGIGTTHVDHHDLQFLPGSGTVLYNTNDGGIWKSTNTGSSWTNISSGIAAKQYYRIGTSTLTQYTMYAGAQDNGTDQLKNNNWKHVTGADGEDCLVDWSTDNIVYTSGQYGNFNKSTNGGTSFSGMNTPAQGDWTTPLVQDPLLHNTLYLGLDDLYKSTNAGTSWAAISNGTFGGSNIIAISVARSNTSYIYAATLGRIARTTNGGSTWTNVTGSLPISSTGISWITVSNTDPLQVYVALTGYSAGNKVFRSVNGGATWTNYSGTLPNIPANCIIYQNSSQDAVYVGTDLGVYYRDASLSDWTPFMDGLPNVMIDELEINYNTSQIRAATYGRSIWESNLNPSSLFAVDAGVNSIASPFITACDSIFSPIIQLKNFGTATLTTVNINYQLDGGTVQTYAWAGSLVSFASTYVTLPLITATSGAHTLTVYTSDPNATTDLNTFNDIQNTSFDVNTVAMPYPFIEGFESTTYPPVNWTLEDADTLLQHITNNGGFGLSTSDVKARFFVTTGRASLLSSEVDFRSMIAPASLDFSVAYSQKTSASTDSLLVQISTDCGYSYTTVYAKGGAALATTTLHAGNFTANASSWRAETIDLTSYIGEPHLLAKFTLIGAAGGNNMYLDDINIHDATLAVDEKISAQQVSVYPNPVTDEINFDLFFNSKEKIFIEIFDVLGNIIASSKDINGTGPKHITIPLTNKSTGIYFYRVTTGDKQVVNGKLIKM